MLVRLSVILIISALLGLSSCGPREDQGSVTTTSTSPPVEYAIGQIKTENPYGSDDAKKDIRYIRMTISVPAGTKAEELQRLLDYFEKDKYAEYDMVQIDVFDDIKFAKKMDVDISHLLARLRITKPGFRESIIFDIAGLAEDKGKDYIINEEHVVHLGEKGHLFDSVQQAGVLLRVMEETPHRAIYTLIWTGPHRTKLTYSTIQEMLIRKTEGVSEETWQGMDREHVERAAKGSGFGGAKTPGIVYTITPYHGEFSVDETPIEAEGGEVSVDETPIETEGGEVSMDETPIETEGGEAEEE